MTCEYKINSVRYANYNVFFLKYLDASKKKAILCNCK